MKKTTLILLLLLLAANTLRAYDLRESVCVVESQYGDEEKSKLGDFALWLSRRGFVDESRTLSAYKNGSSGSGVVIEDNAGRFILTNRHVVGYAKEVSISFVLRDTTLLFEHCRVLRTDQNADLSLIELPDSCMQPAIPLVTSATEEGQDILAAGFPGLGGKPSWQITKGSVSNAYLKIDGQKHRFVQHTASIDPGSSGGPLLIKYGDGYQILGLNTLKAFWRDNVGLAIPADVIRHFLGDEDASSATDYAMLEGLTVDGETWSKMLGKMDKACVDSLKNMPEEMPLDVIKHTLDFDCTPEVKAVASKSSASAGEKGKAKATSKVYDSDFGDYSYVRAEYYNAFSRTQQINLVWERNVSAFVFGTVLSVTLDEKLPTSEGHSLAPGLGLGFRMGAQIPLHMGKNYALPRFVVSPYICPLGLADLYDTFSSLFVGIPMVVGNDFAFPVGDYLLGVGLHYMYDLSFYLDPSSLVTDNNRKILKEGNVSTLMGRSSLSLSLSFGW